MTALADVHALSHAYPGRSPLRFPDLQLGCGEALVIRGPSGVGKSTLVHLLAGVLAGQDGPERRLVVDGLDLLRLGRREREALRPDRVGWAPQRPVLQARLSLHDNLLLPAAFSRNPLPADLEGRARRLLDRLGLAAMSHRPGREASVGQAARVNLARALLLAPPVLVADEPTAALDAASAGLVAEAIADHLGRGGGAVIASHDTAWAAVLGRAAPGAVRVVEWVGGDNA